MADTTPRGRKHSRPSLPSSPLTPPPSSPPKPLSPPLTQLPPAALLLALPGLLAHPPNHPLYIPSLDASLNALRKCLSVPGLNADVECRAWTAFVEVGMQVVDGGYERSGEHLWADGVEDEVQHAVAKGLIIAQKHPSLRAYWHRLSMLQAELAHRQNNPKFSRRLLQRLLASLTPSDPPHFAYIIHLASISHLLSPPSPSRSFRSASSALHSSSPPPSSCPSSELSSSVYALSIHSSPSSQNVHTALAIVDTLRNLSITRSHLRITLLSLLLRLRIFAGCDDWIRAGHALAECENALQLKFEQATQPARGKQAPAPPSPEYRFFEDPFDAAMAVHVLLLGVAFWTHKGMAAEATARLAHLHSLLDRKTLEMFPDGVIQIAIPGSHPLFVTSTHPRVLFLLTYLVSTTSRRDGVGRNPKRKVFASEGLRICDQEADVALQLSPWATSTRVQDLERKVAMIKADLFCELIAVSTMRSEFDAAEKNLNELIAHAQNHNIFDEYAARITLHHAHLVHALGRTDRALDCYQVAAHISSETSFVHVAARAEDTMDVEGSVSRDAGLTDEEREEVREVAELCHEMGGALEAIGELLEACASVEIVKSKSHLKQALDRASNAQDNHLRAIVLALVASYYFHTAGDQAEQMLKTCRQLAAGLGGGTHAGPGAADGEHVGNAPLGLWVGERFVELYRRNGQDDKAALQGKLNAQLERAVTQLCSRPFPSPPSVVPSS